MKTRGTNDCCHSNNANKFGYFKRKSDSQKIQRYRFKTCHQSFSAATHSPLKWQKKRHINQALLEMLVMNASMASCARFFRINPKTVAKKLRFLGDLCALSLESEQPKYKSVDAIQFDELQTIEHTKCKPLSVAMVVSKTERKILNFKVSVMPATGHLAKISRKKYGKRRDDRKQGVRQLFKELEKHLNPNIDIQSDECSYYAPLVKRFFPNATYEQFKGKKGCVAGQGELKKIGFDPLFSINHTFAMLRARVSRLIRRTWNTTKKISALVAHLNIYVWFHNNKDTPDLPFLLG